MFISRTFAIFRKEVRHIVRDVRVLFLVTLAPAFLLLMLSYVFSLDYQHSKVAVLDWDKSAVSRDFIAQITADGDFSKNCLKPIVSIDWQRGGDQPGSVGERWFWELQGKRVENISSFEGSSAILRIT